jgi:hypothetical protein
MLGFVEQPRNTTVFWWTAENPACKLRPHHAKHRARQAFHLRLLGGLLSLAPFNDLAATLHRLLSTTLYCFSCHHAARTWSHLATGSIESSLLVSPLGGHTGEDLSRPLFTCTNTNQAATCTCNTRPRVSPHHVVNHSSHQGVTIHRSSDAPVLSRCRRRE